MSTYIESRVLIQGDISLIESAVRERQAFLDTLKVLHQTTNILVLEADCKNTDWLSSWALDLGMDTPGLEVYVEWTAEEVVGTYGVRNQEFVHRTEGCFYLETGELDFDTNAAIAADCPWAKAMSLLLKSLIPDRPNLLIDAYSPQPSSESY